MGLNESNGILYQPMIIWNKTIRTSMFHKKENLAYTISAPYVFSEPAQATKFLSSYIKDLIKDKSLPSNVIDDKGKINDSIIKTAVVPVMFSELESVDDQADEVYSGNKEVSE